MVASITSFAFQNKTQTPLEGHLIASYEIPNSRFQVVAGGGAGIINNNGAPLFRVLVGLNYALGRELILPGDKKDIQFSIVDLDEASELETMSIVTLKEECPPFEQFNPLIDEVYQVLLLPFEN